MRPWGSSPSRLERSYGPVVRSASLFLVDIALVGSMKMLREVRLQHRARIDLSFNVDVSRLGVGIIWRC